MNPTCISAENMNPKPYIRRKHESNMYICRKHINTWSCLLLTYITFRIHDHVFITKNALQIWRKMWTFIPFSCNKTQHHVAYNCKPTQIQEVLYSVSIQLVIFEIGSVNWRVCWPYTQQKYYIIVSFV